MQAVTPILEGEHSVEVKEQVSGNSSSSTNILDMNHKHACLFYNFSLFSYLLDSLYPCQHSRW